MKKLFFVLALSITTCITAQNSEMDQFITELMKKMTLEEKLGQLNLSSGVGNLPVITEGEGKIEFIRKGLIGASGGINSQKAAVEESRMGIPLITGRDIIHGYKTTFPIPLALSCMWDTVRVEQMARISAIEASSDGINWTYSPMVDISRDPRWGRVAEGAGEDIWLGSKIAKAYVRGYQGNDISANNTIMACVKHFALYGASEAGRDYNTVDMSKISMFQDYLPTYKAAFDAGAGSAMSSFNVIDMVPATGNHWLMTELLREQWGFNGFVVTDFTAINEMVHHGLGTLEEVAVKALKAGIDMDMVGQSFIGSLGQSLEEGKLSQSEIDLACRRVLEAKYKLGLFDKPFQYHDKNRANKVLLCKEHREKAREMAARSCVLLKNDNHVLPLKQNTNIAVVGPLANSKIDMLGTWAATRDTTTIVTIYEGIKNEAGKKAKVSYAQGSYFTEDPYLLNVNNKSGKTLQTSADTSERLLKEAVKSTQNADVIIAILGEPRKWSGEAASRSDITIPNCQKTLLKAMLETGKPVILVLANGRPLTLSWENDNVPAILETWHAGVEAGHGIADVLFGKHNPSGKLTMTFPRNVGQIPIYYNHRNTGRPIDHSHKFTTKYLDVPNTPLFPFGYGLSYTSFEYSDITLNLSKLHGDTKLNATITITNTGQYDGEETVQLYIQDKAASVSRAVKELKDFQKVFLKAGESKRLSFTIIPEDLKFYNSELIYDWESGDFNVFIGTNSATTKSATFNWVK